MNKKPNKILRLVMLSIISVVTGVVMSSSSAAQDDLIVGDFGVGNLTGWQEKTFTNKTLYELVESEVGIVLKADSKASASGLYRKMKIDLEKTPCLTWSWKVSGILDGLDETVRNGDDYPARVYVVFSGGLFFWKTRALNYVWSNGRPIGSAWPNAYTNRSINIAVQSGSERVGQWTHQSRNIRDDYKRLVGEDIKQADAIAIMTDTDDSGRAATAFYGELRLFQSC